MASHAACTCGITHVQPGPSEQHLHPPSRSTGRGASCSGRGVGAGAPRHRGLRPLRATGGGAGEPDFVERLVGKFFGKGALEDRAPAGMKRLDVPEMYPADPDAQAAPLAGDGRDVVPLRPLLANTQLEREPLRLAYDANRDGWTSPAFHSAVDTFGPCLVVAQTAGGALLGGYNPRGWIGLGEDRDSIAAFLFTWPDGDTSKKAIKLPKVRAAKLCLNPEALRPQTALPRLQCALARSTPTLLLQVGGPSLAVIDKPEAGIQFGPDGLTIPLAADSPRRAKSRLGSYYAKAPGGGRSLFAAGEDPKRAELVDLRAYTAQRPEEWQLEGIVWTKQ